MPWLETAPMEQRERFIRDHQLALYTMAELSARYGISRKTGYKWLDRFDEGGRDGLGDRSRAPLRCPHKITEHDRATMTAFVGDDLVGQRDRLAVCVGHLIKLLDGFGQRVRQRLRVAFISALDRHGHDRARVEIHGMLGFVGQMLRPSFILVIFASGSEGDVHSLLEPFFFRFRSSRANSARVGVSMPDACASVVRNSW